MGSVSEPQVRAKRALVAAILAYNSGILERGAQRRDRSHGSPYTYPEKISKEDIKISQPYSP